MADDGDEPTPDDVDGNDCNGQRADGDADGGEDVDVTVAIDDDGTVIDVTGQRDVAVVVQSDGGEHIYLPPEDFDQALDRQTPYESPYHAGDAENPGDVAESPYRRADRSTESPYDGVPEPTTNGVESTPTGVRIVHPEPVSDLRLFR